jgi:predicted ATP-dependent endonuclease of OLD family
MPNELRIELSDFRAVKQAAILLDGITVLAGENGSGKSTISKLLYTTLKVSSEYDEIMEKNLQQRIQGILLGIRNVVKDYSFLLADNEYLSIKDFRLIERLDPLNTVISSDFMKQLDVYEKLVSSIVSGLENNSTLDQFNASLYAKQSVNHVERIKKNLISRLPELRNSEVQELSISEIFSLIGNLINNEQDNFVGLTNQRSLSELYRRIYRQFNEEGKSIDYNLFEYDAPLINKDIDQLFLVQSIEKAVYIDTPMALGVGAAGRNDHWADLQMLLMSESDDGILDSDAGLMGISSEQIINGSAYVDRKDFSRSQFKFKREDGVEFNLLECATGVKSFSILQILLKNGVLNDRSFMIIDEPEAHLHPQWIVEYANFLVLLNKHVGVKLLLASHNPDMVSALKYIAEKENNADVLNFYLAEKEPNEFTYTYKHLGVDIEEIFNSFNKSYEKLDSYAGQSDLQQ